MMIREIARSSPVIAFRRLGVRGFLATGADRVLQRQARVAPMVASLVAGKRVLELGGPSARFSKGNRLPVYPFAAVVDNVNYADSTLWEESLIDGGPYAPEGEVLGTQFLQEAAALDLGDRSYDVVIASHILEHVANPLRALRQWLGLVSEGGGLVLVLPHRDGTFDHRRPVTTLTHLLADEATNTDEGDETHFEEILRLHDRSRDPDLGTESSLESRLGNNRRTRAAHHHVFDLELAIRAVNASGWVPIAAESRRPYDLVVVAMKCRRDSGERSKVSFLGSPFPSDRDLCLRMS